MIKNLTTKQIISKKTKICKNVFCKALGLMFRMSYPKYALVFAFDKEKLIPITMWFCFIPLDLIFLDAKFKVVEKKENITPWENYFPKKKAKYVIELSTGSSEKIRIGDILSISNIKLS